jgi:hypothetical protein
VSVDIYVHIYLYISLYLPLYRLQIRSAASLLTSIHVYLRLDLYNFILYIHTYYIHIYIYSIYIYSYIIYPYIQYSIYIHFRRNQSVQKLVALQRFEFEYALSPFPMVTLAVAQIWPCWHKMAKGGSEYPESTHKWDWVKECEIPGVSLDLYNWDSIDMWCGFAT